MSTLEQSLKTQLASEETMEVLRQRRLLVLLLAVVGNIAGHRFVETSVLYTDTHTSGRQPARLRRVYEGSRRPRPTGQSESRCDQIRAH